MPVTLMSGMNNITLHYWNQKVNLGATTKGAL